MKKGASEHEIQSTIIKWLEIKGIFHWRNNTGAMSSTYKGKARFMRFGAKGSPDIFVVKCGHIIGIEVKGAYGVQSEDQKMFEIRLMEAGGYYLLARSLEDVTRVLDT